MFSTVQTGNVSDFDTKNYKGVFAMKKILAVILVVTMIFCSSFVTVGAFSLYPEYEIKYGETITVEIPESSLFPFAYVDFTPEESGFYALRSHSDFELNDPYCELYESNTIGTIEYSDDEYGYDFSLEYYFESGKSYYFFVYDYNGEAEFEISLGCAHAYIDGVCENCSEECPHVPIEKYLGLCECGKVFSGTDIYEGDTVSLNFGEEAIKVFRFVPEEDGAYIFSSHSETEGADPAADIYDEEFHYITFGDDEDGLDFVMTENFETGKTYYVVVCDYAESGFSFEVTLEKATHEAEDGSFHPLIYVYGDVPTCTEVGAEDGLYCEDCGEFISGHEEIPMYGHWDINGDGYCEICGGEVPLPDCSHICHSKNPVFSLLWKIIRFFNNLFRINLICECGAYHF